MPTRQGEMLRLFFAFDLPKELKQSLAQWQTWAKGTGFRAAWPRPEGLHLTLAFLGDLAAENEVALLELGEVVASRHPRMELRTTHLGAFPDLKHPRVIWMGLESDTRLPFLVQDLRYRLKEQAFPVDSAPFVPHLTLARPKERFDFGTLPAAPEPFPFSVQSLHLIQSERRPEGAMYRSRGSWSLRKIF